MILNQKIPRNNVPHVLMSDARILLKALESPFAGKQHECFKNLFLV